MSNDVDMQLAADLEKYTNEIAEVQKQLDTLEARKNELFRLGARLEGVITYIKMKRSDLAKAKDKAVPAEEATTDGSAGAV